MGRVEHSFFACAFEHDFSIKEMSVSYPGARVSPHEIQVRTGEGEIFLHSFGAIVFHDVPPERREAELARLAALRPGMTPKIVREQYVVVEDPEASIDVAEGVLTVDRMTPERASIVALTVAQSAAMEYYESIVERLYSHTGGLADRLERRGTVPFRIRPLHRFIGEAVGVRSEVLTVLHLLDKPDAMWDDPAMDQIYRELKADFDLEDRYRALETKLRAVQESLELVLDVARDRRMWVLEATIVLLIVLEIVMPLVKAR
jgi:uncharacterized Rmd1/YagE family protein